MTEDYAHPIEAVPDENPVRHSPGWSVRRRIIFTTLIFCMVTVVYILAFGLDSRVAETAVISSYALAGSTIGAYVFGAVWDDSTRRATTTQRPTNIMPR